ncbi:MAG: hypothetical protein ACPG46_07065 [Thalassotalea sp.]
MKQTIETIWQQGFINDDALIAPKINDLYNQKSKNIVDKFERMFDLNFKAIIAGMAVVLVVLSFLGMAWLGLYIDVLLLGLVMAGRSAKGKLSLDKSMNSYDYLKTFDNWLKEQINLYTRLYRYFYPLLFLGIMVQARFSESMQAIINSWIIKDPNITLIAGTPIIIIGGVTVLTFIIWLSSTALYRWDLDIIYGKEMRKLDAIIAEMEELRQP